MRAFLVIPLYPQYCAATTATVCDELFRVLASLRYQPALRIAPPYYDDPVYIEALASSTETALANLEFTPEVILASFHGVPQAYIDNGDPYRAHCIETMRLLRQRLDYDEATLPFYSSHVLGATNGWSPRPSRPSQLWRSAA